MLIKDILFLKIVYLDRHSLREINNLIRVDIPHTRISGGGRNIVHVHPHIFLLELLILKGLAEQGIFLWKYNINILFRILLMELFYLVYNFLVKIIILYINYLLYLLSSSD